MTNTRRLGVNLGTPNYWDSGQIMRNLANQNPGFEGGHFQSIMHCMAVTATSCTDDDKYTNWPVNFVQGASVEFILGNAIGTTATVSSSTVANSAGGQGVTMNFSGLSIAPSVGDWLVVRMDVPGNAQAGWWTYGSGGATLSTEFNDLSPNTPGKQALRVTVPAGGSESISAYTDGSAGRSFMQLNGQFTVSFRAKSTGGSNIMNVSVVRDVSTPPTVGYFNQNVTLSTSWQDYSYTFSANDTGRVGAIQLQFELSGASVLLDDVAFFQAPSQDNPTTFRNEIVSTLRKLQPGTLRYMDSGLNFGSSLDNMLAVEFARAPAGFGHYGGISSSVPMGLHDFLVLCQAVGTEPWYTMQAGMSKQEVSNLMDYLGGSTSTVYGAKRAALGQTAPWTSVFKTIHLEYGNEMWNTGFSGETMSDAASYGQRANNIFAIAKASPSYSSKSFDLIADGFEAVPSWNQTVLATGTNFDTIDVATYIFTTFSDASSIENIYGPMFAQPEQSVDTPGGLMSQHAALVAGAKKPINLAVYESNISANGGTASQASVNSAVPSIGAGITEAENLLLAMRDLGVNNQNMFSLTGYQAFFGGSGASAATTSPIWGSVLDMGGPLNLQRPNFLAEELANQAILPTLLNTTQTGANPTWNQPLSANDNVVLPAAHEIQSYAFTDNTTLNIILMNLSRTTALPVNFAGLNAPIGAAKITTLTSAAITDSNENGGVVAPTSTTQTLEAGTTLTLPPFSMTVVSTAAPVIPITITSFTASCARLTLSPNDTTTCSSNVKGTGEFNSAVVWSVDQGTISNTGAYVAPSTLPAGGLATVTATSVQDSTKTASIKIQIQPNTITGIQLSCLATTLGQAQKTTCTPTVSGSGSFSSAYTLSVSAGSVTSAGVVTAPATGTSMTVTATSQQDSTKSVTKTLTLTPVLTILGNPVVVTTSTSITASWTLNLPALSGMLYGLVGAAQAGTPNVYVTTTNPTFTLSGLTPGATYSLYIVSYTASQAASTNLTVTLPTASSQSTAPSTIKKVSVTCGAYTLVQGGTTNCSAVVTGTGSFATGVTWSVNAGSVTQSGVTTAPTTGTVLHVRATSTQDHTNSGVATITLTPAGSVTGVTVSCTAASIIQGGSTGCAANVTGTGNYSQAVTWSTTSGSVTPAGVLTAPTTGSTVTLKATSTQDTTKSGTLTVNLNPGLTISTPVIKTTFTSITVSWTDSSPARNGITYSGTGGETGATPSDNNVITAPSYTLNGLTPGATYTLTLEAYTATQSTTKVVTVQLPVQTGTVSSVTLNCGARTLLNGASTSCTASVAGGSGTSQAVKFTTSGGSVSATGTVVAPATGSSITVTAVSVADPSKTATFLIALQPTLAISNPVAVTTSTSITVSWTNNVPARNGVAYSTPGIAAAGTPYDNNYLTTPSYTLKGLKPGATYDIALLPYTDIQGASKHITVTLPAK